MADSDLQIKRRHDRPRHQLLNARAGASGSLLVGLRGVILNVKGNQIRIAAFICLVAQLFFIAAFWEDVRAAVIPVTKFQSTELKGGVPAGWKLDKKSGAPSLSVEKEGNHYYLHLMSNSHASFGLRTAARVNVKDYPILTWRWKVDKMPAGGDVRKAATDDQALQVYVAFKETGFPAALNTPVVGYIWDNEAPKGWMGRSAQMGGDKLRIIVLRNKTDKTGQWYTERRNVYEDYKKLFYDINRGEPLGVTTGLQVHINAQHTKTYAEGRIGDIAFSNETADVAATQAEKEIIVARTPVISAPRPSSPPKKAAMETASRKDFGKSGCIDIRIAFGADSAQVESIAQDHIQAIMEYLLKHPKAQLALTGHTDAVGGDAYNRDLSQKRAESVKKYLAEQYKIDEHRMITRGAGESQPIADNGSLEGQALNRRVAIESCPEEPSI